MADDTKYSGHMLSEVVNGCNDAAERRALADYLNGKPHQRLYLAESLAADFKSLKEGLAEGEVCAELADVVDDIVFCDVLSVSAAITYESITLPLCDDGEEGGSEEGDAGGGELVEDDRELTADEYAELSHLEGQALRDELTVTYDCECYTYRREHLEDSRNQHDAYKAAIEYFRAAAAFAKGIGSDAARLWLEACRLLVPPSDDDTKLDNYLELDPERVRRAWSVACEAESRLWIDRELHNLPPAEA